jgi:NAD(P)-dependent dehydrogenase (short-subunit alcohol dehydrogenase family)
MLRSRQNEAERYDVSGKTVFITGAARGIGAAVAQRLHAKGANVALVGLEPELLQANVEKLGSRAIAIKTDASDYSALQAAVAETVDRFGGIDVGIANAGIAFTGPLSSAPIEQVERTFAVNLLGVWRTDRALIEEITKRKGYLLNIASLAAAFHAPLMGPYATTKAGVEALSNVLRVELSPSGVSVGCAYFGFIDTDIVRNSFMQPSAQTLRSEMPSFLAAPAPLSKAVDAIEDGIERRVARLWAPRWVGPAIALRTLFQPLTERRTLREPERLAAAIRAATETSEMSNSDPLLGVAVPAKSAESSGVGG